MRLFPLTAHIARHPLLDQLDRALSSEDAEVRAASAGAVKPALLAALAARLGRPALIVTSNATRARRLVDELRVWAEEPGLVLGLPEADALFYERLPMDPHVQATRLHALTALAQAQPAAGSRQPPGDGSRSPTPVVVTTARALMQRLPSPGWLRPHRQVLRRGDIVRLDELLAGWVALGYRPSAVVVEPGTFSRRGGIVDVYPPTSDRPVRLDFFGDEIDTLRAFDPITQRSEAQLQAVEVPPAREVPVTEGARVAGEVAKLDLSTLLEEMRGRYGDDIARLRENTAFEGIEFYAPFFGEASLLDYLPDGGWLVLDEPSQVNLVVEEMEAQARELREELIARGELPANFPQPYWGRDEVALLTERRTPRLEIGWTGGEEPGVFELTNVAAAPQPYGGRLRAVADDIREAARRGLRVVLTTHQAERVAEVLGGADLAAAPLDDLAELPPEGSLTLIHGSCGDGWDSEAFGILLLTDTDLFGTSRTASRGAGAHPQAGTRPRRRSPSAADFLSDLKPGDYVVHIEHGIAIFRGTIQMAQDGLQREYLLLEYSGGDKLYVPTDQIDRVNRYIGPSDSPPTIHRLGGTEWARAKERVKKAVRQIARELLQLYAAREARPGYAFSEDTVWQRELEDAFPFVETPDQITTLEEIKADMERPRPMDRLICGDVGYGKTEIALRAAFKAVMDGKQVAVLVPTTVLAQQHYQTFCERMAAFPVKVEMLSRFRSEKEQQAVIEGLKAATVDICIGTHRIVQKDVEFKDLGLVIIDEEQRFGVAHKERLKQLRTEVDVLTLTATPIPRTLHMSLTGVRDLSVMETPPEDRLPIRTYVNAYDEGLIREVILRELDRGGQIFFVHNRVQTIHAVAARLKQLVPEAIFLVGHGQMGEDQLEQVMVDFADGKADVLICTTIIESGLDIPNANTIVVNNADRFGLAQLYQLRGRVGRSANRAYAYFLFPKDKQLSPTAEKRLQTIFEARDLGAGFSIAMKDMEIRGAGNLLGAEQSGHVGAVGFDLYCRLMAEAVEETRGQRRREQPTPVTIDLPIDAFIPASYVEDQPTRLSLYQRLANADEETVGQVVLEMRDRFGAPPPEVANLAYLLQLKALAIRSGVQQIKTVEREIVLVLDRRDLPRARLTSRFGDAVHVGNSQIRLDLRPLKDDWMGTLQQLLETLAEGAVKAAV